MALEFEEEKIQYNQSDVTSPSESGLPGLLIKKGLAKDARDAYKILVILTVVLIILAVVVLIVFTGPIHEPIYQ